ncbi:hypothetical protein [Humidesulfovibrio mexicanus]|uniref:hypothetical protein n=1 Tax=Humidesulfovibrio mexicanus TaxID=147047 RepID=UPI000B7890C1|nr:hypothetical protein [Humidesulfovibrio mexicanus]
MSKSSQRVRFRMGSVRVNWQALMHARPRLAALARGAAQKAAQKVDVDGQHFLPGLEYLREKMPRQRRASKGVQ